ncbi:VOC family protein [Phenylobacterium sp. J426]|uniref:VOC family protein n=1 Tax=Phenylobacterium sp. J426 TaxID=2898439 RepID=UPI00215176B9|nr:VOC family protein [Phenylobacterium sp. J426]MCR5873048.1 VOC family protein [Phenylobacterium sp. J426]
MRERADRRRAGDARQRRHHRLQVRLPEQVKAFHDAAVANGGTSIEDPPGERNGSLGPMHLAYVRDPDGNKLCAIHRPG